MKRNSPKPSNFVTAKTPDDLSKILGLTSGDVALMKYKAGLSTLAVPGKWERAGKWDGKMGTQPILFLLHFRLVNHRTADGSRLKPALQP